MVLDNLGKFQLKRVNPFQGLVIDADAWRDAHDYHRNHLRLHLLAFHQIGIVEGLEVVANSPADGSVAVQPGIAVDPDGNVIVVPQKQGYRLQTSKAGTVYLAIQFREVGGEPYQPPEGGQPTRMLDAYKIEERDKVPASPYLELARIDFDAKGSISDSMAPQKPGRNEIDLRFRKSAQRVVTEPATAPPPPAGPVPREIDTLVVGLANVGTADGVHLSGLQNLVRQHSFQGNATVEPNVALDSDLRKYSLLYIAGSGRFDLDAPKQAALSRFLQLGGTIMGEGCAEGGEDASRGAREFGLSFNQLAGQLKRKLEIVKRDHNLLSAHHVFPEIPPGAENGMLLEGGHMIYSGSDYGCAWQGGHQGKPLSREVIRSAFEIGDNILAYARAAKGNGR